MFSLRPPGGGVAGYFCRHRFGQNSPLSRLTFRALRPREYDDCVCTNVSAGFLITPVVVGVSGDLPCRLSNNSRVNTVRCFVGRYGRARNPVAWRYPRGGRLVVFSPDKAHENRTVTTPNVRAAQIRRLRCNSNVERVYLALAGKSLLYIRTTRSNRDRLCRIQIQRNVVR